MQQSASKDDCKLREFGRSLAAIQPGLHTIQILTANPHERDSWRWLLLSQNTQHYDLAVKNFTNFSSHDQIKRTLAFEDNKDPNASYFDWPAAECTTPAPVAVEIDNLQYSDSKFSLKAERNQKETLENRLTLWNKTLALSFPQGGSTLWLTIKHRLQGWQGDNSPISSMFIVFTSKLDDDQRNRIIFHAREKLFDCVLYFYETQIVEQYRILTDDIENYLKNDPEAKLLAFETTKAIKRLLPIFRGRLPTLIEGAAGTGKLAAAKNICKSVLEKSAEEIIILDAASFTDRCVALNELKNIGLMGADDRPVSNFAGTVIFDDIHLASIPAQRVIWRLISEIMKGPDGAFSSGTLPWFVITVAPSLDATLRNGSVAPEFLDISSFRISLPTLHDRLGAVDISERVNYFREIVEYLGARAQRMFPTAPTFFIDDGTLESWMKLPWGDNYRGLRQRVLSHVIESTVAIS